MMNLSDLSDNLVESIDDECLQCQMCDMRSTNLNSHITRTHKLSCTEYKLRYPGFATCRLPKAARERIQQAQRKRHEYTKHGIALRAAPDRRNELEKLNLAPLACRLCQFTSMLSLITHITRVHSMSMKNYRSAYPNDIVQRAAPSTCVKLSIISSSPESIERLLANRSFPSELKHWLRKGYTYADAISAVSMHQRIVSLTQNNPTTRALKSKNTTGDKNPMSLKSLMKRYNVSFDEARKFTTCYKRTGAKHPMFGKKHTIEALNKISNAPGLSSPSYRSKGEIAMAQYCSSVAEIQTNVSIAGYNVDVLFPDHKLIVEYFGDMWHMNPKRYHADDINCITLRKASDYWAFDSNRTIKLNSAGYTVHIIWESDWKYDRNRIENEIHNAYNK